jgi:CheY-like chemotaxis protein
MHILFVDDLPDTCEVFKLAFRLDGHTTRVAHNGLDAVEAVREENFDAIIMDVEMPQLNGWDATRQIRTLPQGGAVPIIMFTAYGTQADRNRAQEAGANDLMQKPVLPNELLSRIKELRKSA